MEKGHENQQTPVSVVALPKSQEEVEMERKEREERQEQQNAALYQQLMYMAQIYPIQAQIEQMNKLRHEAHNQPKNSNLTRFEPLQPSKPVIPKNEFSHRKGKYNSSSPGKGIEHVPNHPRAKKHKRNDFIGPTKPQQNLKQEVVAHCISCEMVFYTMSDYALHMSGHDQCTICDYVAHKTLVQTHMVTKHGQEPAPNSQESPQEIEKYLQERRRRFPSRDKMVVKPEQEQESADSQQVLENVPGGEEGEIEVRTLSLKRKRELRVCKFFSSKGFCRKGDECKFLHVDAPKMSMPSCLINVQII